jgi:hypothetical protein
MSRGDEDVEDGDVEAFEQRAERFPKTLFALSRCRIAEDEVPETCLPIAGARQRTGQSSVRGGAAGRLRRVVRLLSVIFFGTRAYL